MFSRIKQMLIKEFLQIFRDPRMRLVVLGMPVIQMMVMAFALNTDVTKIRTALLDMDKSPTSRELLDEFTAGGYFRITHEAHSWDDMVSLLDHGDVRALIHIPAGYARDLKSGKTARVQVITDGTDSNTAAIVKGYSQRIIQAYSNRLLAKRLAGKGITAPPIAMETVSRAWFNTNQESKYYYVPALIAVMLFIFSIMLTSIGIVKEKEIGTIEQVMVTPIRKIEFIFGKTIPYMLTGYFTMSVMFVVARLIFNVHVAGNIPLLYALTGIYLCGNMGVALVISASASTQQQALLTSFLFIMPGVMLSGFMFPIKNMPVSVQYLTHANPIRWYLEILRGIVMKGVGMEALWPQVAWQSCLAVIFIFLAAKRFRKTLS
ncbi:MAG: ABC transporter permease [Thermodesulfobacteriota bacterium]|nr:ABC transporter permease [Thermodesulfobacteriota bacterium]